MLDLDYNLRDLAAAYVLTLDKDITRTAHLLVSSADSFNSNCTFISLP